ncbi:MAG: glycerophosphoryl diester phosphodiesterase membrane domain-containing protein [Candidatus Microbacterium colombiense]|nr:MAG: glycerophosphoryl diester phosphodiesterase membrane domain-containing protein [Microbacterium sp.]
MQSTPAGTPAAPPTAWRSVRTAAGAAWYLLRRRILLILVVSISTQGLYVWIIVPLLLTLFQGALDLAGVDGLSVAGLPGILRSPLALLVLVLLAVVATFFVLIEISMFSVVAHVCFRGEAPTATAIVRGLGQLAHRAASWQVLLFAGYALLVLPLSHIGVGASVTSHIAIPEFISGELTKTALGAWTYLVVILALMYLALRLTATAAALTGDEESVLTAMRRSVALTRRPQALLFLVLLVVGLVAGAIFVVAALLGTIPVAIAASSGAGDPVAGSVLALLDLVRFIVTGLVAAFISFFFVALYRGHAVSRVVAPVRDRLSRTISVVLLVVFGLLGAPTIAFAGIASAAPAAPPLIIAHRGYTAGGVENTIPALRAAADAGADIAEMDIQETADQGFVVIHDVGLRRLAGDPRSVYELDEAEATRIVVRDDDHESTIPSLEEYIRTADELGIRVLVEVKPHGHEAPGLAGRVVDVMNALDPDHRHLIQSLDAGIVDDIRAADPERTTVLVTGFQIGNAPRTSADGVAIEDWSYSDEMLVRLHDESKTLFVWTVNDSALLAAYAGSGVDGIITDSVTEAVTLRQVQQEIDDPVTDYLFTATRTIALYE